jgi:S-disulfanyl-L-cysteine oxidoreductase SoxD
MSRCTSAVLAILLAGSAAAQEKYPGVGRTATPAEIAAWDIDVRPDFKGLPAGSGSVAIGQAVWEAKCASCHGTFGESNEVFTPIVGGTTAKDIETGRVAALKNPEVGRTTMMKLSSLSTLWDYINRAMPWNAPRTLTTQEVYAVTAYILNLSDIVRDDFVLSDRNIGDVQKRLPNRNGMTREHGLWELRGKSDVSNAACMKDCVSEVGLMSALPPDATRDTHGNPLEQNRVVGPGRGTPAGVPVAAASVPDLAKRKGCLTCHGVDKRIVGPTFHEIAVKYRDDVNAQPRLIEKVRIGGSGSWGALAMPAHHDLPEADAKSLVKWILDSVP